MNLRSRIILALAVALVGAVAISGLVLATPSVGQTSITLATGRMNPVDVRVKGDHWKARLKTRGMTDVTVVENHIAPGGTFGWHSHPGPSIIVVKSGDLTFYDADDPTCSPTVRHAGEALVDEGTDVHIGRNEGTVEVVVIVTRLLPAGAPARIDQPASKFCGF